MKKVLFILLLFLVIPSTKVQCETVPKYESIYARYHIVDSNYAYLRTANGNRYSINNLSWAKENERFVCVINTKETVCSCDDRLIHYITEKRLNAIRGYVVNK